jgi:high-affinity Fe2+/Pb2+ permease
MISGAVPMVSLGALATIAKEVLSSTEALSSTAKGVIGGTAVASSFGCFFVFLALSSSLESLLREASCLEGKSIVSCFIPNLAAIF